MSDAGKAANDVEVEQVVEDEEGGTTSTTREDDAFASFVQVRGSIPPHPLTKTPTPCLVLACVTPPSLPSLSCFVLCYLGVLSCLV